MIDDLPDGVDTDIRERGVNLSGGERQRLALARGLYAAGDSSLLLLDEPTSSVDRSSEAKIYNDIFKTFSDACILCATHALHLQEYMMLSAKNAFPKVSQH